jgi:hypothetical protein
MRVVELTPRDPPDAVAAAFEKHFACSFHRVYAYVFARTHDHDATQRLTRTVLTRALPELVEGQEPELSVFLLRTANRELLAEAAQRAREEVHAHPR